MESKFHHGVKKAARRNFGSSSEDRVLRLEPKWLRLRSQFSVASPAPPPPPPPPLGMFNGCEPRPCLPTTLQGGGALSGVRHTCALLDHLTLKPAVGRAQGFPTGTRTPGWAAPRPGKVSRRPHCLLGGRWRWVCQVGGALGRNRGVPGPAPPTSRPGYPRASDGPVLRRGGRSTCSTP